MPSEIRTNETSLFQRSNHHDQKSQLPLNDWTQVANFAGENAPKTQNSSVKVAKETNTNTLPDWIDAFGVDPTYEAPPTRAIKPVACFYVLIKIPGNAPDNDYYKAVYLMERTLEDLIVNIAMKCGVEPANVVRTLRINSKGLKIMVDDEVVRELPEGQDMTVEFLEMDTSPGLKQEPDVGASTPKASELPTKWAEKSAVEMRLLF